MKNIRKRILNQDGDVMIESTIVLTIVIVFIFFLLMLGFYLFQQMSVYVVANDTASTIASIYSYNDKEPTEGYITLNDYNDTKNTYRYVTNAVVSVFSTSETENKAKWYAYYNLNNFQYITPCEDPQVTVTFKTLSPLKTQVNVKVIAKYDFPIVSSLSRVMGTENDSLFIVNAEGSAVCTDISEYMSRVGLYCDVFETITGTSTYGNLSKSLSQIKSDINKILAYF